VVAAVFFPGLITMGLYLILAVWAERKLAAKVQWRYGPLYVSEKLGGVLQTVADLLKLAFSELVVPSYTNRALFAALPAVVFFVEALPLLFIPGGPGLVMIPSGYGLLYVVAIILISTPAVVAMAWAEADKFTFIGLLRELLLEAAYEVPLVLSLLAMALVYGTDLSTYAQGLPGIAVNPVAFFVYLVATAMATSRFPFEIPDADAEIVLGPYTEYGSSLFLLAYGSNYVKLYAMALLGALVFLGGWAPLAGIAGIAVYILKASALTAFWLLLRAVYPRMRIDQALRLGWRELLFLSAAAVGVSALWRLW
jgi:NADH-quinone oxidoreductase subunit H